MTHAVDAGWSVVRGFSLAVDLPSPSAGSNPGQSTRGVDRSGVRDGHVGIRFYVFRSSSVTVVHCKRQGGHGPFRYSHPRKQREVQCRVFFGFYRSVPRAFCCILHCAPAESVLKISNRLCRQPSRRHWTDLSRCVVVAPATGAVVASLTWHVVVVCHVAIVRLRPEKSVERFADIAVEVEHNITSLPINNRVMRDILDAILSMADPPRLWRGRQRERRSDPILLYEHAGGASVALNVYEHDIYTARVKLVCGNRVHGAPGRLTGATPRCVE